MAKRVEQQRPVEIREPVKQGNAALVEDLLARALARLMAKEARNAVQSSHQSTKAA